MATQTEITAFNFRVNGHILGFKDEAPLHGPKGPQLTTKQPIRKCLCGNNNSGRHVTLFLILVTAEITTTKISFNQTARHKVIY